MSITDGWDGDWCKPRTPSTISDDFFNGSIFIPERNYMPPIIEKKYIQVLITTMTKQKCKLQLNDGTFTSALVVIDHDVDVKWIDANEASCIVKNVFNIAYEKLDYDLQEFYSQNLVRMANGKHGEEVRVVYHNESTDEIKTLSVKLLDRKVA